MVREHNETRRRREEHQSRNKEKNVKRKKERNYESCLLYTSPSPRD